MHIFLVIPIIFVSFLENLAPCLCETIHKVNIRLICFFLDRNCLPVMMDYVSEEL